jgi:predicted nucleic acid-binding protein
MGFVRLSTQPAIVKTTIAGSDAVSILESNVLAPEHEFWPLERPFHEMEREIRQRLMGHRQVTDAVLLDLAIRRGGCLATFDRGIASLLAADSKYRSALEILPAE